MITPIPSERQYGSYMPMGRINRGIVQRTFGLNELSSSYGHVILGPENAKEKQAQLQALAYGPQFRYEEYAVLGWSRVSAMIVSVLLLSWNSLMFNVTPVSALSLPGVFFCPQSYRDVVPVVHEEGSSQAW